MCAVIGGQYWAATSEIMKLFVGVNLFLDVLTKRAGWKQSFWILTGVKDGTNEGYVSAPSIIYFLRREIFP